MKPNCSFVRVLKEQFSDSTDTIHFTLQLDENSPSYSCQLLRLPCTSADDRCADGFTYRLYVDRTPIMEHAVDAARTVGVPEDLHVSASSAGHGGRPPTYDETVDDVDSQLPPYHA